MSMAILGYQPMLVQMTAMVLKYSHKMRKTRTRCPNSETKYLVSRAAITLVAQGNLSVGNRTSLRARWRWQISRTKWISWKLAQESNKRIPMRSVTILQCQVTNRHWLQQTPKQAGSAKWTQATSLLEIWILPSLSWILNCPKSGLPSTVGARKVMWQEDRSWIKQWIQEWAEVSRVPVLATHWTQAATNSSAVFKDLLPAECSKTITWQPKQQEWMQARIQLPVGFEHQDLQTKMQHKEISQHQLKQLHLKLQHSQDKQGLEVVA